MPTYVALLRGINVGGKNKMPMADLRAVVESLGHTDVSTFIQSGNVIFTSAKAITPGSLERAIERRFGMNVAVVLRTGADLARVVRANPFPDVDTSKVHVGFMARPPAAAAVADLDVQQFRPDEFVLAGEELYYHLPNGMARTKLPGYLDRKLKVPTTLRNWNTVTKLHDLVDAV